MVSPAGPRRTRGTPAVTNEASDRRHDVHAYSDCIISSSDSHPANGETVYRALPLWMHSSCMEHQVNRCASLAFETRLLGQDLELVAEVVHIGAKAVDEQEERIPGLALNPEVDPVAPPRPRVVHPPHCHRRGASEGVAPAGRLGDEG
jgi:hypothetical protein